MPRVRRLPPKPNGRPTKPINWDLVDQLLLCGSSGIEIAPHFNIHPDTLYIKCQEEFGMGFTDYSYCRLHQGKSSLRLKQFNKAMKGDNQMLLHLGKHILGQWDNQQKDDSPKEDEIKMKESYYASQYRILQLEQELNDLKSKTSQELQRGDTPVQPMDRSGEFGQDLCIP